MIDRAKAISRKTGMLRTKAYKYALKGQTVENDEVTVFEASRISGVLVSTVRRYIAEGLIPAKKMGAAYLIKSEDVPKIKEMRRGPVGKVSLHTAYTRTGMAYATLLSLAQRGLLKIEESISRGRKTYLISDEEIERLKKKVEESKKALSKPGYLTPLEASNRLGVSRIRFYQLIQDKIIKAEKVDTHGLKGNGSSWIIPESEVKHLLDKMKTDGLVTLDEVHRLFGIERHYILLKLIRSHGVEKKRVLFKRGFFIRTQDMEKIKSEMKKENETIKKTLSITEAAAKVGITRQALYIHIHNNHLKTVRIGVRVGRGIIRIVPSELERFQKMLREMSGKNFYGHIAKEGQVTVKQAAEIVGTCPANILRFIHENRLRSERTLGKYGFHGRYLLDRKEVERFAKTYTSRPPGRPLGSPNAAAVRFCPMCHGDIKKSFVKGWKFCPFCGGAVGERLKAIASLLKLEKGQTP